MTQPTSFSRLALHKSLIDTETADARQINTDKRRFLKELKAWECKRSSLSVLTKLN